MKIGALNAGQGVCEFVVWAPFRKSVELRILSPRETVVAMKQDRWGYWKAKVNDVSRKTSYLYRLDKKHDRPDPASHFQPGGVHSPSQVVLHDSFKWEDTGWKGISLQNMIIYEVHIGTFTTEGTFDAAIPRLPEINDLGINTIEIMPVAQFPGKRNWGYDGVFPFAVQNSYGGPEGLKRFVNECHKNNISVVLDVVYNHFGPEGNYVWDYGPYFTDKYKTPWGMALNFDDAYGNEVRNFFIENALHWFSNYHIDALRLDAIHGISDFSAKPFLQELAEKVKEFSCRKKRRHYLIAESDLNDTRVIRPGKAGGFGLHAQWCDDFHHSLHTLMTGEKDGYYADFGKTEYLVKSLKEGFVYSGEYSQFRKRNHGNSSKDIPANQFIVFSQNHDQIGNRLFGERLANLVSFESLKLAAGSVMLSPYIPLLFMGEEYGEDTPFLYFVGHSDPELIEAVRRGRKEEFKAFTWSNEPPDPQSASTFLKSRIDWKKRKSGDHKVLLNLYKCLIQLRKEIPAFSNFNKKNLDVFVFENDRILFVRKWKGNDHIFCCYNFNKQDRSFDIRLPQGAWNKVMDSSDKQWRGPGTLLPEQLKGSNKITLRRESFIVYRRKIIS
ncbi:MAG: malto-oligosyltrehalose trehalohydrolase [Nitrospirota bacterium]